MPINSVRGKLAIVGVIEINHNDFINEKHTNYNMIVFSFLMENVNA